MGQEPCSNGKGRPDYRGFTTTLRHATLCRTPLDEWTARRRDLYLTTHNTHKRRTSMPSSEFEPTISASEQLQSHALDRAASGFDSVPHWFVYKVINGFNSIVLQKPLPAGWILEAARQRAEDDNMTGHGYTYWNYIELVQVCFCWWAIVLEVLRTEICF